MKRKICCIIGSTKFKKEMLEVAQWKSLCGEIVLMPLVFNHADGLELRDETKELLDHLSMDKIKMADYVFVVNKGGYIGESTKKEIEYAKQIGKEIRYREEVK